MGKKGFQKRRKMLRDAGFDKDQIQGIIDEAKTLKKSDRDAFFRQQAGTRDLGGAEEAGLGDKLKNQARLLDWRSTLDVIGRDSQLRFKHLSDERINKMFNDVMGRDVAGWELDKLRAEQNDTRVKFWIHGTNAKGGELWQQKEERKKQVEGLIDQYLARGLATNRKQARKLIASEWRQNYLKSGGEDAKRFLSKYKDQTGKTFQIVQNYIDGKYGAVKDWEDSIEYGGDFFEGGGILGNLGAGEEVNKAFGSVISALNLGLLPQITAAWTGKEGAEMSFGISRAYGMEDQHAMAVGSALLTILSVASGNVALVAAAQAYDQLGKRAILGRNAGDTGDQLRDFAVDTAINVATMGLGPVKDAASFARVATGAFLLNTAGGLIKEQDIDDALVGGVISGISAGVGGALGNVEGQALQASLKGFSAFSFGALRGAAQGLSSDELFTGALISGSLAAASSALSYRPPGSSLPDARSEGEKWVDMFKDMAFGAPDQPYGTIDPNTGEQIDPALLSGRSGGLLKAFDPLQVAKGMVDPGLVLPAAEAVGRYISNPAAGAANASGRTYIPMPPAAGAANASGRTYIPMPPAATTIHKAQQAPQTTGMSHAQSSAIAMGVQAVVAVNSILPSIKDIDLAAVAPNVILGQNVIDGTTLGSQGGAGPEADLGFFGRNVADPEGAAADVRSLMGIG